MKIKSNASNSEKLSPFYLANEKFCVEIEKYITNKGGSLEGKYNAWSYIVDGEIFEKKKWNLKYKKATFSSSGNLFLSSEYQSLLVLVKWETKIKSHNNAKFKIRKKTLLDFIKITFSNSIHELSPNSRYVALQKAKKSDLITKLSQLLKPLFNSGEVFEIHYENDILTIDLRAKKHYFDILEKLIAEL